MKLTFTIEEELPDPENMDSIALALEMKKYGMKPQNKKRNVEILKSIYNFFKIKELPENMSHKLATFDLENQISNDPNTEWYHAVDSRPEYSYSPWERDKDLMDQYEAQDAAEYREKVKKRALEKINKYRKKRIEESNINAYDGYIGYRDLI